MKAWRLHAYGDHRFGEVPLPETKPGCVLVKVKVVQVAIVEVGLMEGMSHLHQSGITKSLSEGKPLQLGHEFCGEVVDAGQGVTSLKVGDRVCYPGGRFPCGTCPGCRAGKDCLSPLSIPGEVSGAFAEYTCIPEQGLARMPEGPTDNEVAAFQPLGSCVKCVRSAGIKMGDTVVLLGQGSMGLGCLQIAKLAGAGLLIAVGRRAENLDLARDFGADIVINAREVDPIEEVKRVTDNSGADIVFELAGGREKDGLAGSKTIEQAMQMVKAGGKIIEGANLEGMIEFDTVFMRIRGISFINPPPPVNHLHDLQYAAFLVASKRVKVGPQISHVLHGLENLPEAAKITANKAKYHATNPAQIVV